MTELEELEEVLFYPPPHNLPHPEELVRFRFTCTPSPTPENFLQLFLTKGDEDSDSKR